MVCPEPSDSYPPPVCSPGFLCSTVPVRYCTKAPTGGAFRTAWRKDFDRPLTDAEVSDLKRSIPLLMELHDEFTPFDREAPFVIDRVIRDQSPLLDDALPHYTTGGPTSFDDMPSARGGQPRAPAGRPDGGRWIPRAPSDSDL